MGNEKKGNGKRGEIGLRQVGFGILFILAALGIVFLLLNTADSAEIYEKYGVDSMAEVECKEACGENYFFSSEYKVSDVCTCGPVYVEWKRGD